MRTNCFNDAGLSAVERQFLHNFYRRESSSPAAEGGHSSGLISVGNGRARLALLEARSEPLPGGFESARTAGSVSVLSPSVEEADRQRVEQEFRALGGTSVAETLAKSFLGPDSEVYTAAIRSALEAVEYAEKRYLLSNAMAEAKKVLVRDALLNFYLAMNTTVSGSYADLALSASKEAEEANCEAAKSALLLGEAAEVCHLVVLNGINGAQRSTLVQGLMTIASKMHLISMQAFWENQCYQEEVESSGMLGQFVSDAHL